MELDAKWFEQVFANYYRRESIVRILSFETEAASRKGDSYLSTPTRVNIKTVVGSGQVLRKSIVIKSVPTSETEMAFIESFGLFKYEIKVYTQVLPQFEALMNEMGDSSGILWPRCLGTTDRDDILLEDLKASGFHVPDRMVGLDLTASKLCLWSLGRFHALSVILYTLDKLRPDYSKVYLMCSSDDYVTNATNKLLKSTIDTVRNEWGPQWKSIGDKLEEIFTDGLSARLEKLAQIDETKFNVLNHGDFRISNLLLKYCPVTRYPVDIRFVDFQTCHYNLYALDLVYFLYTSVQTAVRRENFDELVSTYREAILSTFEAYSFTPKINVPSVDSIKDDIERLSLLSLATVCLFIPSIKCPPENIIPLEDILEGNDISQQLSSAYNVNKEANTILQEEIPHLLDQIILE